MKEYELIIHRGQPPCGGKATSRSEIQEIETDDILAYVQSREKDAELTVEKKDERTTVVSFLMGDGLQTSYEFTEV